MSIKGEENLFYMFEVRKGFFISKSLSYNSWNETSVRTNFSRIPMVSKLIKQVKRNV